MAKPQTRSMPPLSMRGAFAPETIDEEKRTVELVWTTGARVMRGGWWSEPYLEELSLDPKHVRMGRLDGGAPLLNAHSSWDLRSVLGVVESARLEKGRGTAVVRFAKAEDDPEADAIFRKVKDGILRNVSVGYRVHKLEKVEEEAGKVPVKRATDWEPYEISLVPMGADAGAGVRSEGSDYNPCEFVEETRMTMPNETPAPPAAVADPSTEARSPSPAPTLDEARIRREAAAAESQRQNEIRRIGAALDMRELAEQHAGKEFTTVEAFRALAIDERAKQPDTGPRNSSPPSISAGEDSRDKWLRGAAAGLIVRMGAVDLCAQGDKKRGLDPARLDPGEFRGMTFADLAASALERSGVNVRGRNKEWLIAEAMAMRGAGAQGRGDFPVLLENVLHKTLLGAYATVPDTWREFCAVGSVSDFREHHRYRQGTFGVLDPLNEHGEYRNKVIPDGAKESIAASTRGNIIAVTRELLINDDMGAFLDLATKFGRAAGLTIEVAVYALLALNSGLGPALADGNPLYHARTNATNIGTGAALSASSVYADSVVMGVQKDPSGNEVLDLKPAILLVPRALEGYAKQINNDTYDPDTVANKAQMKSNVAAGTYRKVIGTARLTGTRRYSFADPNECPTLEVAFLNGQQEPVMEMQQGFRTDAIEWKSRLDFGVAARDFRGTTTNAGQ